MKQLLNRFESKTPEVVFEWHDTETSARGWTVINSLRGGAAGGGTRMRAGLDRREVESLAKTMEVKFTVAGPAIGGAKSGIDFDPADPRKDEVLRRWFKAVTPLLKTYYGTGGDLNVDQGSEVLPMTASHGVEHPMMGVVNGHYGSAAGDNAQRVDQLRHGVVKNVTDPRFAPDDTGRHTVADLITGWGVAESVRHYYRVYGGALEGKRVIVQGWGNVGAAAAYYLAVAGARIVGILDRDGGLLRTDGLTTAEVTDLFLNKNGNQLSTPQKLPFDDVNDQIWSMGAELFLPCAASRLVTRAQVDAMIAGGLEVVGSGANVPFADPEIFYGPIYEYADQNVAVIPDFIANCGMARAFALLMDDAAQITDDAIFGDVSTTIGEALERCHARSSQPTLLAATAFEIALDQLV
ncbi:Glu/Leu/Phe/Val dehydrogenase dimerization domain-containing protein [Gordonia sp. CPCC 205515]|uniref:Glu/Leu/Phe/Val dehydrogenase dimerization domain-containing protein n=1 Tax=Gordonia sp. CPCC 205515 TaxID=3140791 RepID=UPI003AF364D3